MLKEKKKNPTLSDVAVLAGVSVTAVSKALSDGGGKTTKVSEQTVERIRKAALKVGYSPNSAARQLKTGKSKIVGAIIHGNAPRVWYDLYSRIQNKLSDLGYSFLIAQLDGNIEGIENSLNEFRSRNADVIINALPEYPASPERLNKVYSSFSNMFYVGHPDLKNASCIEPDIKSGILQAVNHLAAKGLKDIALDVTNRFYKHVRMRIEGYKEGLENNDIDLNHEMIIDCNGRGDSVDLLTEKILKLRPQALIAGNDLRAIMLMRNLRELKMDIPGDIKIIGFDNMEFAPFVAPSLSSVDLQNEKLAEAAFEMIFQFIKKGAFPKNITVKPELIIRESA